MELAEKIQLIKKVLWKTTSLGFHGSLKEDRIVYEGLGWYSHQHAMVFINSDMNVLRNAQIPFIFVEGDAIPHGNSTYLQML